MRPGRALAVFASAWIAAVPYAAVAGSSQVAPQTGEYRPPPPPEQPIAYSHKAHLAFDLACANCHRTAETDDHATLPPTATCMKCHASVKTDSPEIQKLAGYDSRKEAVPWRRVYRVPEYVYFSHRVHSPANKSITCETCHGNVREMAVMQKVKDISMAACQQCHTEKAAPNRCDTCHEPRG